MPPASATTGGVVIESTPPGLPVTMGGRPRGVTPVTIGQMRPGRHDVLVGGPARQVDVIAGEVTTLRVPLTAIRAVGAATVPAVEPGRRGGRCGAGSRQGGRMDDRERGRSWCSCRTAGPTRWRRTWRRASNASRVSRRRARRAALGAAATGPGRGGVGVVPARQGANVGTPESVERYRQLHELGLKVVAPESPGFGEVAGVPSEAAIVAAARDAWDWLRESGVPRVDRDLRLAARVGCRGPTWRARWTSGGWCWKVPSPGWTTAPASCTPGYRCGGRCATASPRGTASGAPAARCCSCTRATTRSCRSRAASTLLARRGSRDGWWN